VRWVTRRPAHDNLWQQQTRKLQKQLLYEVNTEQKFEPMSFLDPITIAVILVAAFFGWRLWSVLGQRTGLEREWPKQVELPPKTIEMDQTHTAETPSQKPWEKHATPGSPVAEVLVAMANRDRNFDPDLFLSGAAKAYELINVHFAKGEKASLAQLLSRDVMKDFAAEIDRRLAAAETMVWQLVKVESAKIQDATMNGNLARLTVHFATSVISATTDKAGTIVEGHATAIEKVEDDWTFERHVTASDPNWKLVATSPE
jgi:predicted lipid-binding transport protein (Tim44 family)